MATRAVTLWLRDYPPGFVLTIIIIIIISRLISPKFTSKQANQQHQPLASSAIRCLHCLALFASLSSSVRFPPDSFGQAAHVTHATRLDFRRGHHDDDRTGCILDAGSSALSSSSRCLRVVVVGGCCTVPATTTTTTTSNHLGRIDGRK